jgi:diaminohydroxyphosphoribosylaminopyrimidine deaminase/5-amino-6-(5-phosphoribosylamino)uracil reductase
MWRAIQLADQASGCLLPNPRVGAVVTLDDRILGEGFHRGPGSPHAEVMAIIDARRNGLSDFSRAELFVSLEPCCHRSKRTPPCVPLIQELGFKRVHVSHRDPNPKVRGQGIAALETSAIEVMVGDQEQAAYILNQAYIKNQKRKEPYVHLKLAMTFDGKMADDQGRSKWITGELARQKVHELRNRCSAILTTANTIEADNPRLTVRLRGEERGTKILIWGRSPQRTKAWKFLKQAKGVMISKRGETLKSFLRRALHEAEAGEILVEAGPRLASLILKNQLADRLHLFYGSGFLGGRGKFSIGQDWRDAKLPRIKKIKMSSHDLLEGDLYLSSFLKLYRP